MNNILFFSENTVIARNHLFWRASFLWKVFQFEATFWIIKELAPSDPNADVLLSLTS